MSSEQAAEGACEWGAAPARPRAHNGEVHIWRASLRRAASEIHTLGRLLSEDERDRAENFRFERDRDDFTVARAALRVILGKYLGLPPALLRFSYNAFGKPSLDEDVRGDMLRFNLSHAGGVALYAVTRGREVGVDIEQVRDGLACRDLAERFFSRREVEALCALPEGKQTRAFFDCWTRKEAYVKAHGEGLSLPLDSFDVSLSPSEPAALLDTRGDRREASRWSLREISPGPGYVAAVAVEGDGWRLRCWRWDV